MQMEEIYNLHKQSEWEHLKSKEVAVKEEEHSVTAHTLCVWGCVCVCAAPSHTHMWVWAILHINRLEET